MRRAWLVLLVNVPTLPVIKTDPNEGVSLGALSAFLLHNRKDEIGTMVVPQVNYNESFGTTVNLFAAFYPVPGRHWEVGLSHSTRVNYDYSFELHDRTLLEGRLDVAGEVFTFADGAARFFGFQSRSSADNETNYADEEVGFNLAAAYTLLPGLQLVVGDRFRNVDIGRGAVKSVPFIGDRFSPAEVPGIRGFSAHAQRIGLVYSTLDDIDMPTSGVYGRGLFEVSSTALGSTASYRHYLVELKVFVPLDGARYVTVVRGAYNQTLGEDVPFLERSILGGKHTLRGHGDNRFIDSSYAAAEHRGAHPAVPLPGVQREHRLGARALRRPGRRGERPVLDVTARSFVVESRASAFRAVVRPSVVGRFVKPSRNASPANISTCARLRSRPYGWKSSPITATVSSSSASSHGVA